MDFTSLSIVHPRKIDGEWLLKDYLGNLKVRTSIGRNSYMVKPGLYKIGNPGKDSEVIVTSNYKLTFDIIRRTLKDENVWLLILQTFGVNVWCAAGKGTFGTDELVKQIQDTNLQNFVSHKRVIVPQLGAPGMSAHEVRNQTGFNVKYGPVRAQDIISFIKAGYRKTEEMRSVKFGLYDRFILTAAEMANYFKYYLIAMVCFILISGFTLGGYSIVEVRQGWFYELINLSLAYLSGTVLAPILLPYIPSRYFSAKGIIVGVLTFGVLYFSIYTELSILYNLGWLLLSAAISSFLAMNFTGATTFTSLSGVRKEMKIFVPIQLLLFLAGLVLLIISNFN